MEMLLVTFHKLTFICELLFEGASSVSLYLLLTMFICAHDNQTTNHRKNMLRISPFKIIFSILFLRDNVHKEKIRAILPTQDFVVMILLYQLAKMFPSSWSLITFFTLISTPLTRKHISYLTNVQCCGTSRAGLLRGWLVQPSQFHSKF